MLVVLTCAHGRPEVFKRFLEHIPDFVYLVVVGGVESNVIWREWCRGKQSYYVPHNNKPLGDKWNEGLRFINSQIESLDYLIITGSDDFFSLDLWEYYKTLDVHYFGLLDFYFQQGGRVKYCPGFQRNRHGEPHGAGRALHRNVLEAANWKLWEDNINIGLDASMTKTLSRMKLSSEFIKVREKGFVALDFKTKDNLHQANEYDGDWLPEDEKQWVLNKLNHV